MALFEFEGKRPRVSEKSYIHEMASIIGDVTIGEDCFIGAGAVARGDYGTILIGDRTSIQENSVIHARSNETCRIASDVQLGHGAIAHNCEIKDFAVIGLGSRICDYAVVGVWSIIGEGAVVASGTRVPDGKVAVGVPSKVVRDTNDEDRQVWSFYKEKYAELAYRYKQGLKKIS
ncbi:MAG: gamma carbonic anhydrase family protein [Nitrososphaerales archaeon]